VNMAGAALREQMRALYDSYYASSDYERRYPRPNAGTLAFLLRHGVGQARLLADVGCGNGRYALPALEAGAHRVVACDVSTAAIDSFARRLHRHPAAGQVQLVRGGPEALPQDAQFDCLMMLFGVLSHIGPRAARITALRELHQRAAPGARLLLSVPSAWRRRPLELLSSMWQRHHEVFGDVRFTRHIAGRPQTFYYHLYSLRRLRDELDEGGWWMAHAEAESLMPEWQVTTSSVLERIDRWCQPWLPAALGYGIRVVAHRREVV
jgi:SAM-dependent methyltransferase